MVTTLFYILIGGVIVYGTFSTLLLIELRKLARMWAEGIYDGTLTEGEFYELLETDTMKSLSKKKKEFFVREFIKRYEELRG